MEWSLAMDSRLSLGQTTANGHFKTQIHYLHLLGGMVNPRATLEESLHLPLPNLYFECSFRDPLTMPIEIKSTQENRKHKLTTKLVL